MNRFFSLHVLILNFSWSFFRILIFYHIVYGLILMLRDKYVQPYHKKMRWIRHPHISVIPLIICVIIIAATFLHEVVFQKPPLAQIGRNVEASGVVAEDPEFKKGYTRVQLEADYGRVYIMLQGKQSIARSEELTVSGKLEAGFGTFVAFIKEPKIISIKQKII